jgi:hypothetical protein
MKTAIELVLEERDRQITEVGHTSDHDDMHIFDELSRAAASYALYTWSYHIAYDVWPWSSKEFKPSINTSYEGRIRNNVKAAALLLAEIERLQRAEINREQTPNKKDIAHPISKIEFVDISSNEFDLELYMILDIHIIKQYRVVPISNNFFEDLIIAVDDPTNFKTMDYIQSIIPRDIKFVYTSSDAMDKALEKFTNFEKEIKDKHKQAIDALYYSHGVGESDICKFKFWESRHPNGYSISHNPDMQTAIGIFEFTYLVELYPCDFSLH